MRTWLVLTLLISSGPSVAMANTPAGAPATTPAPKQGTSLSGVWSLDRAASQDTSEVLKAQGVSWAQRQAAAGMDMTLTLEDRGTTLKVHQVTSARTQTYELTLDGVERQLDTENGPTLFQASRQDGGILVRSRPVDGSKPPMTVHRSVQGGALIQTITVVPVGGKAVSARLVFRAK